MNSFRSLGMAIGDRWYPVKKRVGWALLSLGRGLRSRDVVRHGSLRGKLHLYCGRGGKCKYLILDHVTFVAHVRTSCYSLHYLTKFPVNLATEISHL